MKLNNEVQSSNNEYKIAVLPGDGIGQEIVEEAIKVLVATADKYNHAFEFKEALVGGAAIDETGTALPKETLDLCLASQAVFLGAVGGPKWDTTDPDKPRPEQGLLGLRKELGLFANLRPVKAYKQLAGSSTLKAEVVEEIGRASCRERV